MHLLLLLGIVLLCGCTRTSSQGLENTELSAPRWWRGNLHTHSFWSDGDGFAELVLRDYRDAGYHFVALTEHDNIASQPGLRTLTHIEDSSCGEAYSDYQTRWLSVAPESSPASGSVELMQFAEIARELDESDLFLALLGEEISAVGDGMRVHVTTLAPNALVRPVNGDSVPGVVVANLAAARADNPASLAIVNHPNHDYAITAEDLASIREIEFVEIFSGHRGVRTYGDGNHPPVERLWDVANSLRIAQSGWPPIFGVANDDAHDYYCDLDARPERGWVQVRARALSQEVLFAAMRAGDFYASTGVELARLDYDPQTRTLSVEVAPEDGVGYAIEFIGTRAGFDPTHTPRTPSPGFTRISDSYSTEIGALFERVEGASASYVLAPDDLYVRAVVISDRELDTKHNVYRYQVAMAWTQPVGWETRVTR